MRLKVEFKLAKISVILQLNYAIPTCLGCPNRNRNNETTRSNNVNDSLNTNISPYLETSSGQNSNL
jgi:hypothetical protein